MGFQVAQQIDHRHIAARSVWAVQRRVLGGGEERVDPRGVILGGNRAVGRKNICTKDFDLRVIALVVLGDSLAEPG
jgi:hypothetical protein